MRPHIPPLPLPASTPVSHGPHGAVKENWKSMKQSFEVNILTFDVNYYQLSPAAGPSCEKELWVFVLMWSLSWFLLTALTWKICRNCNFILLFCFLSARNHHHQVKLRLSLEHYSQLWVAVWGFTLKTEADCDWTFLLWSQFSSDSTTAPTLSTGLAWLGLVPPVQWGSWRWWRWGEGGVFNDLNIENHQALITARREPWLGSFWINTSDILLIILSLSLGSEKWDCIFVN